jgi:hypothetical protein
MTWCTPVVFLPYGEKLNTNQLLFPEACFNAARGVFGITFPFLKHILEGGVLDRMRQGTKMFAGLTSCDLGPESLVP